jgi:cyclopropane-fatty-acyl-phospholipid synthase
VTFIDEDYRSIGGCCDAFVSIGMIEHVGRAQFAALGSVMDRVLAPARGRGLLHFIGRNVPMPFNPWITKYIFPDAYAPTLDEVLRDILEPSGFSVVDVENLRLHYARTLQQWLERFEDHAETIARMFEPEFVRMWRLYLASAQACFLTGDLQLFQVTFARPADNTRPWTRESLYAHQLHGSL